MKPITIRYWFLVICFMSYCGLLRSQDTLRLSLPEAEQLFLRQNLQALAGSAQVSAVQAEEIQAKLYPNPSVRAEMNIRDPENNKWAHVGGTGQQAFEIEQLIILGGKRKADLALAKANTEVARYNLETLLRSLLQQIKIKAVEQYIGHLRVNRYDQQLLPFSELIKQVEIQVENKNLPVRDLLRLQTTFLQMQQERMNAGNAVVQVNAELRLLLGTTMPVQIRLPDEPPRGETIPSLDSLTAMANRHRPELKLSKAELNRSVAAVTQERKRAIPDLTGFANYDRQSGAFRNEFNMGIGIPIPVFSRNQGAIKAAKFQQQVAGYQLEFQQRTIQEEVIVAYRNYTDRKKLWEEGIRTTEQTFSEVMNAAMDHYRKGNISLLEFMDLYESGMEAFNSRVEMQAALLDAVVQLNFLAGENVLPLHSYHNHLNFNK